jgi:hypothetical protein
MNVGAFGSQISVNSGVQGKSMMNMTPAELAGLERLRIRIEAYKEIYKITNNEAATMVEREEQKGSRTNAQKIKVKAMIQLAKQSVKAAGVRTGKAVKGAGIAVRNAGVATGKGAYFGIRAPNRGVRRGFFGAMQGIRQFRANKVRTNREAKLIEQKKAEIFHLTSTTRGRVQNAQHRLSLALDEQRKLNRRVQQIENKYKNMIGAARTANTNANVKKQALQGKANSWGTKKTGVKFGKFW